MSVQELLLAAKQSAPLLARAQSSDRNQALAAIADELSARAGEVLSANAIDLENGK